MLDIRPSILGIVLVGILFIPALNAFACGDAAKQQEDDRSWVKSEKIIYLGKDGKIFEAKFNSQKLILLADHGFEYISDFMLSPDTRFIYYNGKIPNAGFVNYLYNTQSGADIKLPDNIFDGTEFSPDSNYLLWSNGYELKRTGYGLRSNGYELSFELLDSINAHTELFSFPSEVRKLDRPRTDAKWGRDGENIYLSAYDRKNEDYYRFNLKSRKFTKISGRVQQFHDYKHPANDGVHYIENGKEILIYKSPCLQSLCSGQGKAERGETAFIDKHNTLIVKTADGKVITIDHGTDHSQEKPDQPIPTCGGVSIRMLSWLENGRYLIYQLGETTYIYGIKEHRKAELFNRRDSYLQFGWEDKENRKGYSSGDIYE